MELIVFYIYFANSVVWHNMYCFEEAKNALITSWTLLAFRSFIVRCGAYFQEMLQLDILFSIMVA